jgi:tRNA (cytidine/uridine-2'-O-)-methyltransferase
VIHVLLYQPDIPPNTGNIIRLCANTGASLHLIEPLGFELDDVRLKRAGLDYHEWARVEVHASLELALDSTDITRVVGFTTKAERTYTNHQFEAGDGLLFGPETRGLPAAVLGSLPPEHRLRIPMRRQARSLNLSNAVAIAVYEAWRQLGWSGLEEPP